MTKAYQITMTHQFLIKTTDIQEVMLNYQFPDFSECESIVGEPEYLMGGNEWLEIEKVIL